MNPHHSNHTIRVPRKPHRNLYRNYHRISQNAVVTNRMKIYRIFYCFIFTQKKKELICRRCIIIGGITIF